MGRYKVGDKVRVRRDLAQGIITNAGTTSYMAEFAGKIVTISDVREST